MIVIATACLILFVSCFLLTREHIRNVSSVTVLKDFRQLIRNYPWWILIGAALCFNMFNTIRGGAVAYFFADVIGSGARLELWWGSVLFYAGLFLSVGEVANMIGVGLCVPIASALGKKPTFIMVNILLMLLSTLFFFISDSEGGYRLMLLLQVAISALILRPGYQGAGCGRAEGAGPKMPARR